MKETLQELLRECLKDAKGGKGSLDPGKYPSQVCLQNDLHQNNVNLKFCCIKCEKLCSQACWIVLHVFK